MNSVSYIIEFRKLTSEQKEGLDEKLSAFGVVRKVNDKYYRIESSLYKEELLQQIVDTTKVDEENVKVIHPGDLYFMF